MKKTLSILALLLVAIHFTNAQEKLLSKDEVVQLALENNFGIRVAKNQVEIADNNASILNSGYLPTLTGNANANYSRDDNTIEFPGQLNQDGSIRGDIDLYKAGKTDTFMTRLSLLAMRRRRLPDRYFNCGLKSPTSHLWKRQTLLMVRSVSSIQRS